MDKLRQRRSQMLIHSYLYYELDTNVISDHRFDELAVDLAQMDYAEIGFYDDAFKGWTGDTGCHLPRDMWVAEQANRLLKTIERLRND